MMGESMHAGMMAGMSLLILLGIAVLALGAVALIRYVESNRRH